MHQWRRGIIGKIGGFAALCAVLLLSLAPTVSQALQTASIDSVLTAVCASDAHDDAQRTTTQTQTQTHPQRHDALAHLQACGYCNFITHAPAPPSVAHQTPAVPTASESFVERRDIDALRTVAFTEAQPRAPPAFA